VGSLLGLSVLGANEGGEEGATDGDVLGSSVGPADGCNEGEALGLAEG
jgi:hypothetical protein